MQVHAPVGNARGPTGNTGDSDIAVGASIHIDTLPSLNTNRQAIPALGRFAIHRDVATARLDGDVGVLPACIPIAQQDACVAGKHVLRIAGRRVGAAAQGNGAAAGGIGGSGAVGVGAAVEHRAIQHVNTAGGSTRGIAVERDGAAVGQQTDTDNRHLGAGLGQNRRSAGRTGGASAEVDTAAIQADGSVHRLGVVQVGRVDAHVAAAHVLSQGQAGQLVAGVGVGRIEVIPRRVHGLSKTIAKRLYGEGAGGVDVGV